MTQHFPINATSANVVIAPFNADRRALYIRNYANSAVTMWVAFGQAATQGINGELEILPGSEYSFGGSLMPSKQTLPGSFYLPNCPPESVNVICASTATGCVITQ